MPQEIDGRTVASDRPVEDRFDTYPISLLLQRLVTRQHGETPALAAATCGPTGLNAHAPHETGRGLTPLV
jgi:hypothetical protein